MKRLLASIAFVASIALASYATAPKGAKYCTGCYWCWCDVWGAGCGCDEIAAKPIDFCSKCGGDCCCDYGDCRCDKAAR